VAPAGSNEARRGAAAADTRRWPCRDPPGWSLCFRELRSGRTRGTAGTCAESSPTATLVHGRGDQRRQPVGWPFCRALRRTACCARTTWPGRHPGRPSSRTRGTDRLVWSEYLENRGTGNGTAGADFYRALPGGSRLSTHLLGIRHQRSPARARAVARGAAGSSSPIWCWSRGPPRRPDNSLLTWPPTPGMRATRRAAGLRSTDDPDPAADVLAVRRVQPGMAGDQLRPQDRRAGPGFCEPADDTPVRRGSR